MHISLLLVDVYLARMVTISNLHRNMKRRELLQELRVVNGRVVNGRVVNARVATLVNLER